jgi:hypothetical protein
MTAREFHERMLHLLRREPFETFEVELTGGDRFLVERPEMIGSNGGVAVFGGPSGDLIIFDWTNTRRLGSDVAASA